MRNINKLVYCLTLGLLVACSTPKDMAYLEDIETPIAVIESEAANFDPKFKVGDCLVIAVSGIDPLSVAPFNLPLVSSAGQSMISSTKNITIAERKGMGTSRVMQTYTVESDGTINFPVLGRVQVLDKNRKELTADLEKKISKYVDRPIINISIDNFKVSVLGEVKTPGSFPISSDRISVFDALGLAGDLTIYGNRKNVKLIRDRNGDKKVVRLDLTDSSLLSSPYFYLEQNDVVYVEPNNKRKKTSRYSEAEQYHLSMVSTLASALSVVVSVIATIVAMNK